MAKNLTGLAQPGDYILGRGTVYVALLLNSLPDVSTAVIGGWRDLGNCPEFTLSIETEKLEHRSSRSGLQVVDKEVILSQKMSVAFTLDEFNDENLALWSQGDTATPTNPTDNLSAINTVIATNVTLGRWYDILDTAGERLYDISEADITLEESTPTALNNVDDYILDQKMGRVFLRSNAVNIAAGQTLQYDYTEAAGPAPTLDEVRGLTSGQIQVALKFIAENPASSNKQREYHFHTVTLASEGDVALIGDEYATMGFSGAVESNTVADTDAPFLRIRDHANS